MIARLLTCLVLCLGCLCLGVARPTGPTSFTGETQLQAEAAPVNAEAKEFVFIDTETAFDAEESYITAGGANNTVLIWAVVDYASAFNGQKVRCRIWDENAGAWVWMQEVITGNIEIPVNGGASGTLVFYYNVANTSNFGMGLLAQLSPAALEAQLINTAGISAADANQLWYVFGNLAEQLLPVGALEMIRRRG